MNIGKEQTRNKTKYLAIPMAIFLLSAYSVLPGQTAHAVTASIVAFQNCFQDKSDTQVDMNSVLSTKTVSSVATEVVKTIHIEKEIYECNTVQSNISVEVDLTTYLELFETLPGGKVFKALALATTCVKDEDSGTVLGCTKGSEQTDVQGNIVAPAQPLRDPSIIAAEAGLCNEQDLDQNANHVQDVNTVVSSANPGVVKTVDAQKEAFDCGSGSSLKKIDVVIFQDTIENLNTGSITQTWQSATCLVEIAHASVESCVFSPQSTL